MEAGLMGLELMHGRLWYCLRMGSELQMALTVRSSKGTDYQLFLING
jgi:hypothetical protein